jgi:hypothetical protein
MDVSHGSSTRFLEDTVDGEKELEKIGSGQSNKGYEKCDENRIKEIRDDENIDGKKADGRFDENFFRVRKNNERESKLKKLRGSPILHLHHTVPPTPGFRGQKSIPEVRGVSGSTEVAQNNEKNVEINVHNIDKKDSLDVVNKKELKGKSIEKTKAETENDSTERIIQRTLRFSSHQDLIEFLQILLRFSPFLRSDEIENYFEFCGIDFTNSTKKNKSKRFNEKKSFDTTEFKISSKVEELKPSNNNTENENKSEKINDNKLYDNNRKKEENTFYGKIDYLTGKILLSPK